MSQQWEMIGQMVLAAVLAGVLGWERGTRGQPAGMRTYMIVAVAAANFVQVGAYGFLSAGAQPDPTRVAAQVVTGIGFLGAGAIWRTGMTTRGLTTAAGLWASAALGMMAAAGFYALAIGATLLIWLILRGGYLMEERLGVKRQPPEGADGDTVDEERDG